MVAELHPVLLNFSVGCEVGLEGSSIDEVVVYFIVVVKLVHAQRTCGCGSVHAILGKGTREEGIFSTPRVHVILQHARKLVADVLLVLSDFAAAEKLLSAR